jgi:hypothetical protein
MSSSQPSNVYIEGTIVDLNSSRIFGAHPVEFHLVVKMFILNV